MAVLSTFCALTLMSHIIVINNQMNVVSSSQNNASRMFEQFAQAISLATRARSQNNNQEFVNKVITTIKKTLDENVDVSVESLKSRGTFGKTNIKKRIQSRLIGDAQNKYGYLDRHYMDQIINATNHIVSDKIDEYFQQRRVGPLHVQIPTGIVTNWSHDGPGLKTTQEKETIAQTVIDTILQSIDNHSTPLIDELKAVYEMTDIQLIKQACVRQYTNDTHKLWNTWDETFQKRVTDAIQVKVDAAVDSDVVKYHLLKYEKLKQQIESNIPKLIPSHVQQCFDHGIFDINEIKSTSVKHLTQGILSDVSESTEITQEMREFVAKTLSEIVFNGVNEVFKSDESIGVQLQFIKKKVQKSIERMVEQCQQQEICNEDEIKETLKQIVVDQELKSFDFLPQSKKMRMINAIQEIVEECVNQHLSKKDNKRKDDKQEKEEQDGDDEPTPEQILLALLSQAQSRNST